MRFAIVVLTVPLALGCHSEHSWYRNGLPRPDAHAVDRAMVHPVAQAKVEAAAAPLVSLQAYEITAGEAQGLVGTPVTIPPGMKAYLVRAVARTDGDFGTRVTQAPGALYIHTSTMGHSVPRSRAHPIVVVLGSPPGDVFATSGVTD